MTPSEHPLRIELDAILLVPDLAQRRPLPRYGGDVLDDADIGASLLRVLTAAHVLTVGELARRVGRDTEATAAALATLRAKGKVVQATPAFIDPATAMWRLA